MTPVLEGRVAVVTGASRGIGLACVHALTRAGARVAMLARTTEALERAAAECGAIAISCDVGDPDALKTALGVLYEQLGLVPDVLVNNAGSFTVASLEHTTPEVFAHTLNVNLVAPFVLARALVPAMKARRSGHIITIGSIADHVAFPENSAYAASKFGVRGLHEVLRAELRGSGVRTTLVSPGPVDTSLWEPIGPDQRAGFTPRAQMLGAEAVADAVLYAVTQPASVNVDELRISRS